MVKSHRKASGKNEAAVSTAVLPTHPVPQLQGPFEESILESMNQRHDQQDKSDSVTRRKQLLERERYERTCAGRWKQRRGEKFHPLWKLVSQISFGMQLLAKGQAKSEEEVMKILQKHVDEIDGFLERSTEDFALAQKDIQDRIQLLKVPLENANIFDSMLEQRDFRLSIVDGNEKIEHIVDRTSRAMNDALKDIQKGIDATRGLGKYLAEMDMGWDDKSEALEAVYLAMVGNVEGWNIAFMELQMKGNSLGVALVQLGGIIAEMSRRAGIASRRTLKSPLPVSLERPPERKSSKKASKIQQVFQADKPLPVAPDPIDEAVQATLPSRHPEHKAARRRSRQALREVTQESNVTNGNQQVRISRSFPELFMGKSRHVSILDGRGRSPSLRRRLSKKRPIQSSKSPRPSSSGQTPQIQSQGQPQSTASRKSSFFSSNQTSPSLSKDRQALEQTRSFSFPPPTRESATSQATRSEADSEAATSASGAPAPFVPKHRSARLDLIGHSDTTGKQPASSRIPIVVLDDISTTPTTAPSVSLLSTTEGGEDTHDVIHELPGSPPNVEALPFRQLTSSPNTPTSPKRRGAKQRKLRQLTLFPVKSVENLKFNGMVPSPTLMVRTPPPRSSSTPPVLGNSPGTRPSKHRPPNIAIVRPTSQGVSLRSPQSPHDSDISTVKGTSPLLASSPAPATPDSVFTALPSVPIPPRNRNRIRYQPRSAVTNHTSTSAELIELLSSAPPSSSLIHSRQDHPNPLRSHMLSPSGVSGPKHPDVQVSTSRPNIGDESSSPSPPGPGGPVMLTKYVTNAVEHEERRPSGGNIKRMFSRRRSSKRKSGNAPAEDGWFKGMGKDGVWIAGEWRRKP